MQTRTKTLLILGALLGAAGCAGQKEQVREEQPREEQARWEWEDTREGIVTRVEPNQLTVQLADRVQPLRVELAPGTSVILDDEEVSQQVLNEGLPVRVVLSDMDTVSGYPRAERIEVLSGEEAEEVQREVR